MITPVARLEEALHKLFALLEPMEGEKAAKKLPLFDQVMLQLSSLLAKRGMGCHEVTVLQSQTEKEIGQSRTKSERGVTGTHRTQASQPFEPALVRRGPSSPALYQPLKEASPVKEQPVSERADAQPALLSLSHRWLEQVKMILDELTSIEKEAQPIKQNPKMDPRYSRLVEKMQTALERLTSQKQEDLQVEKKQTKVERYTTSSKVERAEDSPLPSKSFDVTAPVSNKSSFGVHMALPQGKGSRKEAPSLATRLDGFAPYLQAFSIHSAPKRSLREKEEKERDQRDGEEEEQSQK
jgi:hypothetical protein